MYGDALTTRARVKDRLKITTTDFDTLIDNLILAVTANIQQITGRRFIQATYSNELHDGSDIYGTRRTILIPKNAPIQTVERVEYKAGSNSTPNWTLISIDDYDVDFLSGILRFRYQLPYGLSNVRVTYTGGFSGYSLGISNFWFFNIVPTGAVNGVNQTFTLPENADQVIVYADGVREAAANITFTPGTNTFTLAVGREPNTSMAVDYKRSVATSDADFNLPADLVDVCERAVIYLFKMRDMEGRTTESFQESSVTWRQTMFTDEMKSIIRNYRRGYNI
jgi:hypothetical protein